MTLRPCLGLEALCPENCTLFGTPPQRVGVLYQAHGKESDNFSPDMTIDL